MKQYDIFTDPEFKADCERDQIEYEYNKHTMKIECAWCNLDIGTKPCNKEQQGKISHGICPECKKKLDEELCEL